MAKKKATRTASVRKAPTITLDDLIATSSASTIRTFRDLKIGDKFKPIIWVGIWIEPFGGDPRGPVGPRG